jgi:hypothetical protein
MDGNVIAAISELRADGEIDPGEGFVFDISAANRPAAEGGVRIKDVRFRLVVADDAVARLIVPDPRIAEATDPNTALCSRGERS